MFAIIIISKSQVDITFILIKSHTKTEILFKNPVNQFS